MSTHQIYAEETISVTSLRSQITRILEKKRPVAILSHNETAGYIVNAEVFARLVEAAERADPSLRAQFRPSADRLRQISENSAEILLGLNEERLAEFDEQ